MLTRTFFRVDPFAHLVEEMDRIFGGMSPGLPAISNGSFATRQGLVFPLLNVWQDEQAVHAEAELPGFSMENIEILATGDTLTIKGKREITPPEGAKTIRAERSAGTFERTISLPVQIDVENVQATLTHGVLTVTLPKAHAVLPRKIQVKTR